MPARRLLRPRNAACAASAAFALALVGCSATSEPSPTPSPIFTSELEAYAAAEEVYRGYNDAFNAVDLADPATFDPVFDYTAGEYERSEREYLSQMHALGFVRGGAIEVETFEGTGWDADRVRARACNDVSATTFTDAFGVSVVPLDRPEELVVELTFILADGTLALTDSRVMGGATCVAD